MTLEVRQEATYLRRQKRELARQRALATAPDSSRARDRFIEQAVAGLSIGLVLIDPLGCVAWMNRTAEQVLGVSAASSTGRLFRRVLRDPQLIAFWEQSRCQDGNCLGNVCIQWPAAMELKVNATACRGPRGEEIGRALLFCDVTSERTVRLELTRDLAQRLREIAQPADAEAPLCTLTVQELRALRLLGKGASNVEIASQMGVAVSTVRTHLKHVYEKLGLRSRTEAVRLANRQKLS